jgi:hypothetical protein
MALDSTKFVMEGPATVTFLAVAVIQKALTTINPENAKFQADETVNEKERADGSKTFTRMGKECMLEAAFEELSPADMDLLTSVDNFTCAFANTSKTIAVTGLNLVSGKVADGKTVITAKKSAAAGTTWASLFSVS